MTMVYVYLGPSSTVTLITNYLYRNILGRQFTWWYPYFVICCWLGKSQKKTSAINRSIIMSSKD